MCPHKADIHNLESEFYGNHKTVMVSLDVEYISLISDIVNRVKIISHFS